MYRRRRRPGVGAVLRFLTGGAGYGPLEAPTHSDFVVRALFIGVGFGLVPYLW